MMRDSAPPQDGVEHVNRYEALRTYATTRYAPPSRNGLVILLRCGLAAWMAAWSKLPVIRAQPPRVEPLPIPDDTQVDIVHILATMALSHCKEVYP